MCFFLNKLHPIREVHGFIIEDTLRVANGDAWKGHVNGEKRSGDCHPGGRLQISAPQGDDEKSAKAE